LKKCICILATMVITTLLVKEAYILRGYFAVGGEWLVWIFPVLISLVKTTDQKQLKYEENERGYQNERPCISKTGTRD
jgi:hypothetical protein